ncbi:MAG: hypothetical protein P9L99_10160 [Candidatus Lernaella stagnicola]|nr:hypothetical protein [Candidatus Lernaella stagnicola]
MNSAESTVPTPPGRIDYIDLAKGFACLAIMYGHAVAPSVDRLFLVENVIFTSVWFSAPLFFFASGMNVVTFFEKNAGKAGFRMTIFYLLSALILIMLSVCFSVNRGSLRIPNIFQGIAMGTAFTFVLIRLRLPNWALAAISLLIYIPWVFFWEAQLPAIEAIRSLPFTEEPEPTFRQWIDHVPVIWRAFGLHFSFLPWTSYVLVGAAAFRSVRNNPATAIRWAVFFLLVMLAAIPAALAPRWSSQVLLQQHFSDMMARNTPFFFLLWYAQCGLFFLALNRWYRGAVTMKEGVIKRAFTFTEFLGRQSFLFLVWHWVFLSILIIVGKFIEQSVRFGSIHPVHYIPWLTCTLLIVLTMRWITGVGERWRASPGFLWQASLVLVIFTFPGLAAFIRRGYTPFLTTFFSFPACLAFAFMYPELRFRLRRKLTRSAA